MLRQYKISSNFRSLAIYLLYRYTTMCDACVQTKHPNLLSVHFDFCLSAVLGFITRQSRNKGILILTYVSTIYSVRRQGDAHRRRRNIMYFLFNTAHSYSLVRFTYIYIIKNSLSHLSTRARYLHDERQVCLCRGEYIFLCARNTLVCSPVHNLIFYRAKGKPRASTPHEYTHAMAKK